MQEEQRKTDLKGGGGGGNDLICTSLSLYIPSLESGSLSLSLSLSLSKDENTSIMPLSISLHRLKHFNNASLSLSTHTD